MKIEEKYTDGRYLENNPTWDKEDSEWKADNVFKILKKNNISPNSIIDIGCGAGYVLFFLNNKYFKQSECLGLDISPDLAKFWTNIQNDLVNFALLENFDYCNNYFDCLLMLDVFEHVSDPHLFLEKHLNLSETFVFHIPLDLSASSILRKNCLLGLWDKVGHINFYSKDLALKLLDSCGYDIIDYNYTGAYANSPQSTWKTKVMLLIRKLVNIINKDFSVRLLGGETIIVLARRKS